MFHLSLPLYLSVLVFIYQFFLRLLPSAHLACTFSCWPVPGPVLQGLFSNALRNYFLFCYKQAQSPSAVQSDPAGAAEVALGLHGGTVTQGLLPSLASFWHPLLFRVPAAGSHWLEQSTERAFMAPFQSHSFTLCKLFLTFFLFLIFNKVLLHGVLRVY